MTSATHGSRSNATSSTTAVSIISRSASGSATLPNCDSTCQRRARYPSSWSVSAARPKTIPAGQLGPLRSSSSSQTKSGIAAKRSSVSAFGICRTGAETVRASILRQE